MKLERAIIHFFVGVAASGLMFSLGQSTASAILLGVLLSVVITALTIGRPS